MGRLRVVSLLAVLPLAVGVAGCPALFEDVVVGSLPGLDAGSEPSEAADAGFVGGWGAGSFRVFASDAPRDDWASVEFTLARVDVVTAQDEVVRVAEGMSQAFDVRALGTEDGSVRRRFLASGRVPAETCKSVRFWFAGGIGARPFGAAEPLAFAFDPSVPREEWLSLVEVPLEPPRRLDAADELATVDFDLDRFTFDVEAATVTPHVVDKGSRPRTDLGAQEPFELLGIVRSFSAAGGTPSAEVVAAGARWSVRFAPLVAVEYLPSAVEGPAPAAGDRALVTGTFDPVSGALVASSFVLVTAADVVEEGDVVFPIGADDTFDLATTDGSGASFHVLMSGRTSFRDIESIQLDRTRFRTLPAGTRRVRVAGVPMTEGKLYAWKVDVTGD